MARDSWPLPWGVSSEGEPPKDRKGNSTLALSLRGCLNVIRSGALHTQIEERSEPSLLSKALHRLKVEFVRDDNALFLHFVDSLG
jgi:hypothetical protein